MSNNYDPLPSAVFTRREPLTGITEFDYFRDTYDKFKRENEKWLWEQLKNKGQEKDDKKSEMFRRKGNDSFKRKEYSYSFNYYTRSLCLAKRDGVNYGLALANRSATLYYLGDFENCLKNIELCLKSAYPKKFYPKVLLRKCYCLYKLKGEKSSELKDCVESALTFIKSCNHFSKTEKGKHEKQFKNLDFKTVPTGPQILNNNDIEIPPITNGENTNFASASSSVGIRYEQKKGRLVVATENIKRGDVLFVEKAFIAGAVIGNKCYYCVKDAKASIPCSSCTSCVFCDENCFQKSWQTFHKYECLAMRADIFYGLSTMFHALRAIFLGIPSKFAEVKSDEIIRFGSKEDNYPYFNSLLSNWRYCSSLVPISKSATTLIILLQQYTNFFDELPPGIDVYYIGGLLIRHFCQIECNAVVIEHWHHNEDPHSPVALIRSEVTTAVFPSISLMNHSCLPNVNIFYVDDTAIVKAAKDINKNEEVVYCYGFDYHQYSWQYRNKICREEYNFICTCPICVGPIGDYVDTDINKCPHCNRWTFGDMREETNCPRCEGSLVDFEYMVEDALSPLIEADEYDLVLGKHVLLETQERGENIFTKVNPFFGLLYEAFWKYYIRCGDFKNAIKYIKLHTEQETTMIGEPRVAGISLLRALKLMHTSAREGNLSLMSVEDEINLLMKQCVTVLQLYYPFKQSSLYKYMTT